VSLIEAILHKAPALRSAARQLRSALPAWRSARTLRVYLGPQQLSAVMLQAGRELPGSARSVALDSSGVHWQSAVDALHGLLLQARQAAGPAVAITLEVSLASRWCPMVLAPWSDALLSAPEAARFLQTQLAAVYGEQARGWQIVAADAPYASPRTVCGADPLLIEALKAMATEHDCGCQIIAPVLATAAQALPRQALAVVESGRITMALVQSGHITALQSQTCGTLWQQELPQAWQRWSLRAPELAAIETVTVIDLCPPRTAPLALAPPPLPARFRLEPGPFGAPQTTPLAVVREAA